jgi:hypothetical protein
MIGRWAFCGWPKLSFNRDNRYIYVSRFSRVLKKLTDSSRLLFWSLSDLAQRTIRSAGTVFDVMLFIRRLLQKICSGSGIPQNAQRQ